MTIPRDPGNRGSYVGIINHPSSSHPDFKLEESLPPQCLPVLSVLEPFVIVRL